MNEQLNDIMVMVRLVYRIHDFTTFRVIKNAYADEENEDESADEA